MGAYPYWAPAIQNKPKVRGPRHCLARSLPAGFWSGTKPDDKKHWCVASTVYSLGTFTTQKFPEYSGRMPASAVYFGVWGDGGGRRDHHRRRVGVKRRTRILAPDVWVSVWCSTPTGEERRTRAEQQQLGKCAATTTTPNVKQDAWQDTRAIGLQKIQGPQLSALYTVHMWWVTTLFPARAPMSNVTVNFPAETR